MADIKRIIQEYLQEQPMLPRPFGFGVEGVDDFGPGDDVENTVVVVDIADFNLTDEEIAEAEDSDGAGGAGGGGGGGDTDRPAWAKDMTIYDAGEFRFGKEYQLNASELGGKGRPGIGGFPRP